MQATLQPALSVCRSVGWSVGWLVGRSMVIELESVKMHISAPAHPSATGIGRVSGLVDSQDGHSFYQHVHRMQTDLSGRSRRESSSPRTPRHRARVRGMWW